MDKNCLSKIHEGNLSFISGDHTLISGISNGDIYVGSGSQLTVSGIVNGNIEIDHNSLVTINGIVNGQVSNSGTLIVSGMINQCPYPINGNVTFTRGSYLNGKKL